jgi:hypothetical protein
MNIEKDVSYIKYTKDIKAINDPSTLVFTLNEIRDKINNIK